ncbi:hypothetical protein GQ457_17G025910 [Hibiscus cannabinus]
MSVDQNSSYRALKSPPSLRRHRRRSGRRSKTLRSPPERSHPLIFISAFKFPKTAPKGHENCLEYATSSHRRCRSKAFTERGHQYPKSGKEPRSFEWSNHLHPPSDHLSSEICRSPPLKLPSDRWDSPSKPLVADDCQYQMGKLPFYKWVYEWDVGNNGGSMVRLDGRRAGGDAKLNGGSWLMLRLVMKMGYPV